MTDLFKTNSNWIRLVLTWSGLIANIWGLIWYVCFTFLRGLFSLYITAVVFTLALPGHNVSVWPCLDLVWSDFILHWVDKLYIYLSCIGLTSSDFLYGIDFTWSGLFCMALAWPGLTFCLTLDWAGLAISTCLGIFIVLLDMASRNVCLRLDLPLTGFFGSWLDLVLLAFTGFDLTWPASDCLAVSGHVLTWFDRLSYLAGFIWHGIVRQI